MHEAYRLQIFPPFTREVWGIRTNVPNGNLNLNLNAFIFSVLLYAFLKEAKLIEWLNILNF